MVKKRRQPKGKPTKRKPVRRTFKGDSLPSVTVLDITEMDEEGDLIAIPAKWEEHKAPPHIIVQCSERRAPAVGNRVLAKLDKVAKRAYVAHPIRILPKREPKTLLGILHVKNGNGWVEPVSRKEKREMFVKNEHLNDAEDGELVLAESLGDKKEGSKIITSYGKLDDAKAASMIAIHANDIPFTFSDAALAEAEDAEVPTLGTREDLRDIPLVTMDGADARDFDDAVFAEKHKKGWHIIVAIADVAHYVTPDSILDQEARERGNSVYFPDRVVPMLPELLSNGLCSLRPDEDRYCLAVHLWINKEGELLDYRFVRGLMRSQKRFIYEEAQAIYDTQETHPLKPLLEDLYDAYEALNRHREKRGALELDLPEFKTDISDEGEVKAIHARERMDSHKLIEEMMILANVAAADALMKTGKPAMFRAHEIPDKEKIQELRNILEPIGYSLFKGSGVNAKHFNALLNKAKGTQHSQLVSMTVLRSQMQAVYYPENIGHFGLGLQHYTHFTSPIRRYSDLIVHRALLELIDKKQNIELEARKKFPQIAEHISMTERRAMRAERDAFDRYLASYMRNRMGEEFDGYISSVNRAGLFIVLYENGANGFVPISHLDGYFIYNERKNILYQRRGKASFHVGQDVRVRVKEAYGLTGELLFALL